MIAITAYTEHAGSFAVGAQIATSEQPYVYEPEENEELSSFAQLLAGIQQNDSSEGDSDNGLDALAVEKNRDGNKLNLFTNAGNFIAGSTENDTELVDFNIEFSDSAIDKDFQLLSKENTGLLKISSEMEKIDEEIIDVPEFDANTLNLIAELAVKTDLPSAAKTTETRSDAQAQDAVNFAKEALHDAAGKKAGDNQPTTTETSSKNANTESVSKSSSTENSGLFSNQDEKQSRFENQLNNEKSNLTEKPGRQRKDRISFEVRDLRTDANNHNALADTSAGRIPGQAGTPEITLDLRLPDYGPGSQAQTTWEVKAGNALENMLARELHQNFNGDIVRHASMALRDGGVGTIKIALHPETLGNVKIHLEMAENKITGHILVESQEALNAFRKEIAALEQAFRDSGFADASLDLSLTSDGSGAENQELENGSLAQQIAASSYEGSYEPETTPIIDVFFGRRTGSVNMLA